MDEQPIDYVAAALVYIMYDDSVFQSHQTVEAFTMGLNERFSSQLPEIAIHAALTLLVSCGLVKNVSSRFANDYYYAVTSFSEKVVRWRSARQNQAAIVYDNFMNGPAHWMQEAFRSPAFSMMLDEQLTPEDDLSSTSLGEPQGGFATGPNFIRAVDEAIEAIGSADISNSENHKLTHYYLPQERWLKHPNLRSQ